MKIVVNTGEFKNEKDFSIKGDFRHLVENGTLQQFITVLLNEINNIDQTGMVELIRNSQDQNKLLSSILPQALRTKLLNTYNTLKEKGENDLAENIEALACHFMDLEQTLLNQKSYIEYMETMGPRQVIHPQYSCYPGSGNSYDPNHGMIYAQMRPVPGFDINRYNISPWKGSPVEQFKMAKFFHDMMSHYLNSLYILKDKDVEIRYYISKTLHEVQRVQEIIMDLYRRNDSFETKRSDLEGIFEIIFYCNKQIISLRPDDNIMELKKDVFDKFRDDLENTFVQLKK